jgi:hypothetical protein
MAGTQGRGAGDMLASVSDTLHVSATEELFSFSRNYLMVLDAKLGMQQWAPTDFLIQKCMPEKHFYKLQQDDIRSAVV